MPMHPDRASEVLYDSQAVLRLVDQQLAELRDHEQAKRPADLNGVLNALRQANDEITHVLGTLRGGRHALEGVTIDKLHHSTVKIQEVSSATELATTNILDGLERAQHLVDALDQVDEDNIRALAIRTKLREELFAMMEPLQFQDITTQQLAHVSSMLGDVEQRLLAVASLLGNVNAEFTQPPLAVTPFAESASLRNVVERQAQADALFDPHVRRPAV